MHYMSHVHSKAVAALASVLGMGTRKSLEGQTDRRMRTDGRTDTDGQTCIRVPCIERKWKQR